MNKIFCQISMSADEVETQSDVRAAVYTQTQVSGVDAHAH